MWGKTVRGEGTCKNPWDSICMINVYDGPMETAMWVNIRCLLDWILKFGQKTAEIHFFGMCSTSECTKWDAVMADGDELSENANPMLDLEFHTTAWWNEDLCTWSRTENGC